MRQGLITCCRSVCDALVVFAVSCFTVAGILPTSACWNKGEAAIPSPLHGQGASLTTILPGMWYEIKQKQQKMPKARANINVYTAARDFRVLPWFCRVWRFHLVVEYFEVVYSRVKRTPESEKKKYAYLIKRKIKKKMLLFGIRTRLAWPEETTKIKNIFMVCTGTKIKKFFIVILIPCLLYTSPSPRD